MKFSALAFTIATLVAPVIASAEGLAIKSPFIPAAPPSAMAHAAYMTLSNEGAEARQLIGVTAEGYMMAHIHLSSEKDGVATMTGVDVIEIASGQSVVFERGGLHVMLMRPMAPKSVGESVGLVLEFADGTTQSVSVPVMPLDHGS